MKAEDSWHREAVRSHQSDDTCSAVPGTRVGGFISGAGDMEGWLGKHPDRGKRLLLSAMCSTWVLQVTFWSPSFTHVYLISNRSRQELGPLISPTETRALRFLKQITLKHRCFMAAVRRMFLAPSSLPFPGF